MKSPLFNPAKSGLSDPVKNGLFIPLLTRRPGGWAAQQRFGRLAARANTRDQGVFEPERDRARGGEGALQTGRAGGDDVGAVDGGAARGCACGWQSGGDKVLQVWRRVVAMRRSGEGLVYLHADQLGSTSLTTSASGVVLSQMRYKPWGEERWSAGAPGTDRLFTRQRKESPRAGLVYDYGARIADHGQVHERGYDCAGCGQPVALQHRRAQDRCRAIRTAQARPSVPWSPQAQSAEPTGYTAPQSQMARAETAATTRFCRCRVACVCQLPEWGAISTPKRPSRRFR
jgi:hypothetical protein